MCDFNFLRIRCYSCFEENGFGRNTLVRWIDIRLEILQSPVNANQAGVRDWSIKTKIDQIPIHNETPGSSHFVGSSLYSTWSIQSSVSGSERDQFLIRNDIFAFDADTLIRPFAAGTDQFLIKVAGCNSMKCLLILFWPWERRRLVSYEIDQLWIQTVLFWIQTKLKHNFDS